MEPLFDELAKQTFTTVTNLMGVNAVWHSSAGVQVSGQILFKNPSEPVKIGDSENYEYRPSDSTAEYYTGNFPGLKEAVDEQHESQEFMEVQGKMFLVREVTSTFDGKTFVAHLEPHATAL